MTLARFVSGAIVAIAVLVTPPVTVAFDGATWIRTYGGGYGHSVYETPDGGAILGGTFGAGFDCCRPWLIRLNADGSVRWHVTYDAPGLAGANNIVPTPDGGYVMSGEGIEFMVVKVDADGNVLWAKNYGDGGYTNLRVVAAEDGNILVTGTTFLNAEIRTNGRAVLLDPDGNALWQKVYGRPYTPDHLTAATVAYNGNFIVAGSSRGDYWVMELDRGTGAIVWQNVYGGGAEDTGLIVTKVLNRHYLVVGASDSFTSGGLRNWWAVILTDTGRVWKEFSLGGFDAEDPHAAIATSDGGFIIGGGTGSFGSGFSDIWLVKFDSKLRIEWQKTYGLASRTDHAWQIQETPSGYAVIGDSYSFPETYEIWLMTLDRDGNVQSGECGSVSATSVSLERTRSDVRDAGTLTYDTAIRPVDMKVAVTTVPWPIESCAPRSVEE